MALRALYPDYANRPDDINDLAWTVELAASAFANADGADGEQFTHLVDACRSFLAAVDGD